MNAQRPAFNHRNVHARPASRGVTPECNADDVSAGPLFQGMRHDAALDALPFRTRDPSPTLQAWMQDDPCGYVDDLNVYAFCADNPIYRPPN